MEVLKVFDWEAIGAQIVSEDNQTPIVVRYFGHNYIRYVTKDEIIFIREPNEILITFSSPKA